MKRVLVGTLTTILAGVAVFWLTEGLRDHQKPDAAGATRAPAAAQLESEALTLRQLQGRYTLINEIPSEDVQISGFLIITAESDVEGHATFKFPMRLEQWTHLEAGGKVGLINRSLQFRIENGDYSIWREVESLSDRFLTLRWNDGNGEPHRWIFRRDD